MKKDSKIDKTQKKTTSKSISSDLSDNIQPPDTKKQNKELIARANYLEFELANLQLEKDSFESVKKRLKSQIIELQAQHENDSIKIKELTYNLNQAQKKINEIQESNFELSKDQQKTLEKLKNSLTEVEGVFSYKTNASKRYLSKISRVLSNFVQTNMEITPHYKVNLKKFNSEVGGCIEELTKILSTTAIQGKNEEAYESLRETVREKDMVIEDYRKTLESMREKMHLLRDKLKETEKNPSSEKKIKSLVHEKEELRQKVNDLEDSLREQSEFMMSLKEVMGVDEENGKSEIDEEIAMVDQEILELQCSLERVLS